MSDISHLLHIKKLPQVETLVTRGRGRGRRRGRRRTRERGNMTNSHEHQILTEENDEENMDFGKTHLIQYSELPCSSPDNVLPATPNLSYKGHYSTQCMSSLN